MGEETYDLGEYDDVRGAQVVHDVAVMLLGGDDLNEPFEKGQSNADYMKFLDATCRRVLADIKRMRVVATALKPPAGSYLSTDEYRYFVEVIMALDTDEEDRTLN